MLCKIRRFTTTPYFLLIPFFIAALGLCGGQRTLLPAMIINAQIIALILFFCDDIFPAFLPAFCVITLGATNLATLSNFATAIPFALPAVAGTVFHLIYYRRPLYLGASFKGLVATSVAILLSGLGTPLASRDFSTGGAIYHLIGLSVGLILVYLLFASNRRDERDYDPLDFFLWSMFFLGLLCCVVILYEFFTWFIPRTDLSWAFLKWKVVDFFNGFTYRNTISTLLIMCMPTAFYFAKQARRALLQSLYFLSGLFMFACLALTGARTAWLFGTILLLICFVYYVYKNPMRVVKYLNLLMPAAIAAVLMILLYEPIAVIFIARLKNGFVSPTEARARLLVRSFEDFLAHPLFGIGISSLKNTDIYSGTGCICWYHLYFPQIWGSMGLLGMGTYLYQLYTRAKLILTKPTAQTTAMGLVYLGLFLYSQTDPGEFTPLPYAVIAVLLFVVLEDAVRRKTS